MKLHYVKIDKDWDNLTKGDSVTFVLPEESVCYSIYEYTSGGCILTGIKCYNDKIFRILDIESFDFVRNIVGYSNNGLFPEVQSLNDLKKVIRALDDECVKKFGIPNDKFDNKSESKDKYLHPSELKDGDFIKIQDSDCSLIYIFKEYKDGDVYRYVSFNLENSKLNIDPSIRWGTFRSSDKITYATEEEKNLLNEALLKEGYVWNNLTKKLEGIQVITLSDSSDTAIINPIMDSNLVETINYYSIKSNIKYGIPLDLTEEKVNKEELNLFPTKKHYQLNFNY